VRHVLQNVVFPMERDPDLLPLYVDPEIWSTVAGQPVKVSNRAHIGNILDRHRVRIVAGRRVSFGTYFNAFPAAYWQHWTTLDEVRLTVRTSGPATVLVYRSNGQGVSQRIGAREVDDACESTFDIPLTQYSDGGWIWFDIVADERAAIFEGADWSTAQPPLRTRGATVGITTFNKPDYCTATLAAICSERDVLDVVDRIVVIDQGEQLVEDDPSLPAAAAALGDKLTIICQPNLGGSGGFARAMSETLMRDESDFVQLLDDDVQIEPECLRRSIVFARYTATPTLVGGHMFDLLDRPKLHALAEVVDVEPFMWRPLPTYEVPHDFSATNLRQTPLLHARLDADYNGWWMCLIPVETLRRVGLALPAFIKWDDAEYCLRAGAAGYPTVSLPGVALWHVSWVGKDDSIDWQAYFHARNRIVAALLHSEFPRGGTLLRHSRRVDLKHLMTMQYYPIALRHQALRDILSGPEHLRATLATAMPRARELASSFSETRVHRDSEATVRARRGRLVFKAVTHPDLVAPTGLSLRWQTASALVRQWLHRPGDDQQAQPEVEFSKADAFWWRIARYDSAIVSAADGSGKNVYRRDRARHRRMLRDSLRLHRELRRRWPRLSADYRSALADLTSVQSWGRMFEGDR